MSTKKRKKPYNVPKKRPLGRLLIFLISFAIIGGIVFYFASQAAAPYIDDPQNMHHAQCVQNSPSKTAVRPGEAFTATVRIKNTGTSTFAPSFGAHLLELNNETYTNYWSPNRFYMSSNVGPGGTATFNMTITAPSNPGTYPFGWAIGVGTAGVVPYGCSGVQVRVVNPTTTNLTLNGQNQNVTVTKGSSLTVAWSATNGASCTKSGNWSGSVSGSGSDNRSGDTATIGQKTYTISCNNAVSSASTTRTVTVTEPPRTPTAPSPSPSPAPSPVPSPSPSPRPPSTPRTTTSRAPTPQPLAAVPDTEPPADPSDFKAVFEDAVVLLSWSTPSDNTGVTSYNLERSSDGTTWEMIAPDLSTTSYTDKTIAFNATYQYRLHAFDAAANASGYANVAVKTGEFEPNLMPDQELTLASEDQTVTVTLYAGSVEQEARCGLEESLEIPPSTEESENITGPYEIVCKFANSTTVRSFKTPPLVSVSLPEETGDKYAALTFFAYQSGGWQSVQANEDSHSFVLNDSTDFAIQGTPKTTPFWVKLLTILLLLFLVIGGGVGGLKFYYSRRSNNMRQQQYQDYYRKEHGY